MFCYEEGDDSNVVAFSYGGGVMKKRQQFATVTFSFFFLFWSFWSSSLKLIVNNEMVVFF